MIQIILNKNKIWMILISQTTLSLSYQNKFKMFQKDFTDWKILWIKTSSAHINLKFIILQFIMRIQLYQIKPLCLSDPATAK